MITFSGTKPDISGECPNCGAHLVWQEPTADGSTTANKMTPEQAERAVDRAFERKDA